MRKDRDIEEKVEGFHLNLSNSKLSDFTLSDSCHNFASEGSVFPKAKANAKNSASVKKLIRALAENTRITKLDLSNNQITEAGLATLLQSTSIIKLDLSRNNIYLLDKKNDDNKDEYEKEGFVEQQTKAFKAVCDALKSNTTLRELNLLGNGIDLSLEKVLSSCNKDIKISFIQGNSKPGLFSRLFCCKNSTADQRKKHFRS